MNENEKGNQSMETGEHGQGSQYWEKEARLCSKLLLASRMIGEVARSKKNKKHDYTYVPGEAVFAECRTSMQEVGLILRPTVDMVLMSTRPSYGGSLLQVAEIYMIYQIIDVDTGHRVSYKYVAHGIDSFDKAVYKAYTACLKYFLRDVFIIPFGDDPEMESDDQAEGVNESQPRSNAKPQDVYKVARNYSQAKAINAANAPAANAQDLPATEKQLAHIARLFQSIGAEISIAEVLQSWGYKGDSSELKRPEASQIIKKCHELGGKFAEADKFATDMFAKNITLILEERAKVCTDKQTGEVTINK